MKPHEIPPFVAPVLCRHKSGTRDRAYFRHDGKFHWCGTWGTPKAAATYARKVAELEAHGRLAPPAVEATCVAELVAAFLEHAKVYYRKPDGRPTNTLQEIKRSLKVLTELYADMPACEFGPRALTTCRHQFARSTARSTANARANWIRHVFSWGVENELVPGEVAHRLREVKPLQRGRTIAAEGERVRPVQDAHVEAVQPFVSPQVWAMIRLQLLTGARPGEIVGLRAIDLDRGFPEVWTATLEDHKLAHKGLARTLYFNQEAQSILREFMVGRPVHLPLFSPRDAEKARHAQAEGHRRPDQKPNPKQTTRTLGDAYSVNTYRAAIARACDKAGVPRWHPHQLRHTAGTKARAHGLDVAQLFLGHKSAKTTEIYAEVDKARMLAFVSQHRA